MRSCKNLWLQHDKKRRGLDQPFPAKDMHFVVVAAAEGAKAGVIINKELQKEYTKQPGKVLPVL